jgi:hydrogenase-4 component F
MLAIILFAHPILAALCAIMLQSKLKLDLLIILHALLHLGLGMHAFLVRGSLGSMDDIGLFMFGITSVLYLAIAFYRTGFGKEQEAKAYRVHTIFLMLFIAAMDAACMAKDLGLIWIFVEATTITSAMLISFEHSKSSLEAAWKYLFICSVGIALAFVGILLLILAQPQNATLLVSKGDYAALSPFWLKISFVFILVGFGTKIGLAPLHFWLPDAHSEAPAPISALLSGALLNTALLPLLRVERIMQRAGLGFTSQKLYLMMGFISVFIATVFILKTKNYKRLLAYSSIENMGLVMIAFGLGRFGIYAAYLHILGHSLVKAAYFLVAGNVLALYHDKHFANVKGLFTRNRGTAWLWLLAGIMILGFPPSPLFTSKFLIITGLIGRGYILPVIALILMLASIAWSMIRISLGMCCNDGKAKQSLPLWAYISPTALLFIAAVLGIWMPVFE